MAVWLLSPLTTPPNEVATTQQGVPRPTPRRPQSRWLVACVRIPPGAPRASGGPADPGGTTVLALRDGVVTGKSGRGGSRGSRGERDRLAHRQAIALQEGGIKRRCAEPLAHGGSVALDFGAVGW